LISKRAKWEVAVFHQQHDRRAVVQDRSLTLKLCPLQNVENLRALSAHLGMAQAG